ncbi:MAG: bifunctional diaminohydroxyphosphoribosylaminopyrimidine deaminase/5-amino-6-(5-phosphoribosylamino)uracil reductase RibD [Sedimentisphaerales bacterium]|nr:bifunctional diaminohydroxyphosphoribosylaminopyrimidine deaminase/5-amino-6-(5-phosphoribosylamino)uracil reductase RibD [Sedimentisphaerales bacterium]
MMENHEHFMKLAINLAKRGIGSVEPNPPVGAVITKGNQIIGEGYHKKFGEAHAEVNALDDCKSLGISPKGGTLYVTLEPCCHQGKTGPCSHAVINAGISKVYIATIDPAKHNNGGGIEQLKNAGIEVHTGILEKEAKLISAPFMKRAITGKPWVVLKWAQTIDGNVSFTSKDKKLKWISNERSRRDVHKLRRRSQAILVGINTVIADNPMLTARPSKGTKLLRIVMDSYLKIPPDCKLLKTAGDDPVMIYTSQYTIDKNPEILQTIKQTQAELFAYPDTHGLSNIHYLIDELGKRGVQQLMIEGGPTVLTSFLAENFADEIYVYISPQILGEHGGVKLAGPMSNLPQSLGLQNVTIKTFGDNVRITGLTSKALRELGITK